MTDERLDKILPKLVDAITRLLNAKGMMAYRRAWEDELKKLMETQTKTPSVKRLNDEVVHHYSLEDLQKNNPIKLRGIARRLGIKTKKTDTKGDLIEKINAHFTATLN